MILQGWSSRDKNGTDKIHRGKKNVKTLIWVVCSVMMMTIVAAEVVGVIMNLTLRPLLLYHLIWKSNIALDSELLK